MDRIIRTWKAERDADLMLCIAHGCAYQADLVDPDSPARRVLYDDVYAQKFERYDPKVAGVVNAGRCALLCRHLPAGASVLDVGAGDGAFVRAARGFGFKAKGYEIIQSAANALLREQLLADDLNEFQAVCLWDTLEHLEYPELKLAEVQRGGRLFVSIPVFADLRRLRESRHYRPGEHLYYWTDAGFVAFMHEYGFELLERSNHETAAGRDGIGAYAFRRAAQQ